MDQYNHDVDLLKSLPSYPSHPYYHHPARHHLTQTDLDPDKTVSIASLAKHQQSYHVSSGIQQS